jgi:hypothetical protein
MATEARRDVGKASLPATTVAATITKIRNLTRGLESAAPSTWAGYEDALPYEAPSIDAKAQFVTTAATQSSSHNVAVDVGANAGLFTRILSQHFDHVLGIDNDQGAVDALYQFTKNSGITNLTPLVIDITNPTPSYGWRGRERSAFTDRIQTSFATWLAVVHHLCLGLGLPLQEIVDLIAEFSEEAVVEFVAIEDPMAQRISASRTTKLGRYDREFFEECIATTSAVVSREEVSPTRTMYHLRRR